METQTKQVRTETFETICSLDPEVQRSRVPVEDMIKFFEYRDLDLIRPALEQGKPAIYVIRAIPHVSWGFVDRGATEHERFARAFMCGVAEVRNLWQSGGTRLDTVRGTRTEKVGGKQIDIFSEDDLAAFPPSVVLEIGSVAYWHSFLDRRTADFCRLPHTLLSRHPDSAFLRAGSSLT
jgi:hypothetical protein